MARTTKQSLRSECPTHSSGAEHPDHTAHLSRLNRVKGQLEGISSMIQDRRYCPEILDQIRAATSALRSIELKIFEAHLKACVQDALASRNPKDAEGKINELTQILLRRSTI